MNSAEHNFRIGSKVVSIFHKGSYVQEVKSINGNSIDIYHHNKEYFYKAYRYDFRLAKAEEIKAGRRL